jgi:hypothetical protein
MAENYVNHTAKPDVQAPLGSAPAGPGAVLSSQSQILALVHLLARAAARAAIETPATLISRANGAPPDAPGISRDVD